MSRELHIFNLRMLREQYEAEHVDEIVETIDVAIWAIQTQEQLMKERDAAMAQPEIVRCKDCKYYAGEGMYCDWDIIVQYDHFYCYHAERRTDG